MLKRIIIVLFLLFLVQPVCAESDFFDLETIDKYNKVVEDIHKDILLVKSKYVRLEEYNESALKKDSEGVFIINYDYSGKSVGDGENIIPLQFAITMNHIDGEYPYEGLRGEFNFGFPILEIKFTGFQNYVKSNGFDIKSYFKKNSMRLWKEQQLNMPHKLKIEVTKEYFEVGESIDFKITLTNDTMKHLRFRKLNSKTLFFEYDGGSWGLENPSLSEIRSVKDVIVKAGESISRKLLAEGFLKPGEYDISCTYAVPYKGVNPSDKITVKVVR